MPDGDIPVILAALGFPCLVAWGWLYVEWLNVVCLCSGIAFGWWARGRLGAPVAPTSTTVEATVVPTSSSASSAGGFAGVYEDPQASAKWEIKDACQVIAVRESDGKQVWGWFEGSVLTLRFKKEKEVKATLRGRQLEWKTGVPSWIKE